MDAIRVAAVGGPEVLSYESVPEPQIAPQQLLVRTRAIGVNFIDVYVRTGLYPMPLPYIPGSEGAGVVESVGSDVTDFAIGDRVCWAAAPGSYAQLVAVDADKAIAVPGDVSDPVAASALLQGMTAHYLLNSVYSPSPGESILVHAGAGGVGQILTQLAHARGVRVITTVSTPEKADISHVCGASDVLFYGPNLAEQVRTLTDGEGVAATYDGVGQHTFDASLAATRVRGTVALFGAASGPVSPFDPQRLNAAGSLVLTRPSLGHFTRTTEELRWRAGAILSAIESGELNLRVGAQYPLAEAGRAHTDLESRRTVGSIVLIP